MEDTSNQPSLSDHDMAYAGDCVDIQTISPYLIRKAELQFEFRATFRFETGIITACELGPRWFRTHGME
jgi:hypothetical protein